MRKALIVIAAASVLILSACGNNPLAPVQVPVQVKELGYMRGSWDYSIGHDEWLVIYGGTDLQGDCSVRSWGPGETAHIRGIGYRALFLWGTDSGEVARIIDEVQIRAVREAGIQTCPRR